MTTIQFAGFLLVNDAFECHVIEEWCIKVFLCFVFVCSIVEAPFCFTLRFALCAFQVDCKVSSTSYHLSFVAFIAIFLPFVFFDYWNHHSLPRCVSTCYLPPFYTVIFLRDATPPPKRIILLAIDDKYTLKYVVSDHIANKNAMACLLCYNMNNVIIIQGNCWFYISHFDHLAFSIDEPSNLKLMCLISLKPSDSLGSCSRDLKVRNTTSLKTCRPESVSCKARYILLWRAKCSSAVNRKQRTGTPASAASLI